MRKKEKKLFFFQRTWGFAVHSGALWPGGVMEYGVQRLGGGGPTVKTPLLMLDNSTSKHGWGSRRIRLCHWPRSIPTRVGMALTRSKKEGPARAATSLPLSLSLAPSRFSRPAGFAGGHRSIVCGAPLRPVSGLRCSRNCYSGRPGGVVFSLWSRLPIKHSCSPWPLCGRMVL